MKAHWKEMAKKFKVGDLVEDRSWRSRTRIAHKVVSPNSTPNYGLKSEVTLGGYPRIFFRNKIREIVLGGKVDYLVMLLNSIKFHQFPGFSRFHVFALFQIFSRLTHLPPQGLSPENRSEP